MPQSGHSTRPCSCRSVAAQTGQRLQASSSPTDRNNRGVHEDPAPTPEEQEQGPEELPEAQAAEGPGHEDDELPGEDDQAK
jgi:hypothetical protein